jgi:hypothetical protein
MDEANSAYTVTELDTSIAKTLAQPLPNETFSGGFFDYNDLATATTPINVTGGAGFVKMENDGLGANTLKTYKPASMTEAWDTVNDQFDFSELALGDMIDIRFDLEITTTSPNQDLELDMFFGVGVSEYSIPIFSGSIKSTGLHEINRFNGFYMGDLLTRDNPAELRLSSPDNCSVVVRGWYIKIIKRG